jgi:serine phosphatase RsbU (regulator of sigma subunit)
MSRSTGHTAVFKQAFQGLDLQALNMLRQVAVKRSYPAKTVLAREGEPADTLYLIADGQVALTRKLEGSDEDFVLGYLNAGQYFGEMAVITEEPRSITVTTLTDTDVLEITKEHFEQIFAASPAMARSILDTLIGIIRETDRRAIQDLERRIGELSDAYRRLEQAQADRIERAALEAQLDVAARAQRSLLPTELPDIPGYEFAALFEPARRIGGDFYDVRVLEDGRVAVVLADVSDKGPHAALFMAVARTLFLTEARHSVEPRKVMYAVHKGLIESSAYNMFVTAIYGLLDPAKGTFCFVRAGHERPLFASHDGTVSFLNGTGRFLGLWHETDPSFKEREVVLNDHDSLILYSDGVLDMRNEKGVPFGREALAGLAYGLRERPADEIAQGIYNVVQQHRGRAEAFDDFTLLVLQADKSHQPDSL